MIEQFRFQPWVRYWGAMGLGGIHSAKGAGDVGQGARRTASRWFVTPRPGP
jgi:hypothetical protein